jgi:hypothetical protein
MANKCMSSRLNWAYGTVYNYTSIALASLSKLADDKALFNSCRARDCLDSIHSTASLGVDRAQVERVVDRISKRWTFNQCDSFPLCKSVPKLRKGCGIWVCGGIQEIGLPGFSKLYTYMEMKVVKWGRMKETRLFNWSKLISFFVMLVKMEWTSNIGLVLVALLVGGAEYCT